MSLVFLDTAALLSQLEVSATRLRDGRSDVAGVWLFGSLVTGRASPGSDADVLIVLKTHPSKRWFDRTPEFIAAFDDVPIDVDVFPLTADECAKSPLAREAMSKGRRLA